MEVQQDSTASWYSAEYWTFSVGDDLNDHYRLDVDDYSGDAGDGLQFTGNGGIHYHNGMSFTTHDQDNDLSVNNCATDRGGGWWYNACYRACLTCAPLHHIWDSLSVHFSRMMIKPQ